jgi:hexosaminidase
MAAAALCAAVRAASAQETRAPQLLPLPSHMSALPGAFVLANPVRIVVPPVAPRLREIADFLAGVLRTRTGYSVRVGTSGPPAGAIVLDTALRAPGDEAYELRVSADGITIHGASPAGLLWGVQTLRQLLPPEFEDAKGARPATWSIASVDIRDVPRFGWRGSMVDAWRHFFPVSAIKRQIDLLSRYKMNVFHWHLTEDQGWRIEIPRYPRLTAIGAWRTEADGSRYGGFYTQKEIRDVVEFARLRGVTVVPEIEMPGHSSAAIASYPDLGCTGAAIPVPTQWGVFADIYCAGNERTFAFLTSVLDDVMALFPSRYIHIGGDEVPKERWKACTSCQDVMRREGLASETELQGWFVRRIGDYLARHGRMLIGWDEVLQGGLFPGATVQAWEDTSFTRRAAESGHDVIASPSGWTYFNRSARELTLDEVYRFEPVPPSFDSVASRRVLGGEAAFWSENITSQANLELMAFPRLLALAEVLWSSQPRDSAAFHARLENDQLPRLLAMGVATGPADRDIVRVRVQYDSVSRAPRVRTEYGAPGVIVRMTSDGAVPRGYSPPVADSTRLVGEGIRRLQAFHGNEPILAERRVTLVRNTALGKHVTAAVPPSTQYPGTGAWNLTDGIAGSADHADGLWQGWWGPDVDVVVDLESPQPVDTIRVTFLQNVRAWIVFPSSVEFAVSDDGVAWRPVATIENDVPVEREGVLLHAFEAVTSVRTRARFIRVVGHNAGVLPAWHPGAGRRSWLFADEVVVR